MGNIDVKKTKVLVRGAGDLASGIIWNLAYAGFKVCCTDIEKPSCIRTEVSFSNAIYDGKKVLGNVECVLCDKLVSSIDKCWDEKKVALVIDPDAKILDEIKFDVVVDAILAKKNLGTTIDMADLVIGVGPGFTAKKDCHYVIETMRGHNLAKIYENGSAIANTGIPGLIASHGADRVMHSPATGVIHNLHKIGDKVNKDDILAVIDMCEGSQCVAPTNEGSHSSPVQGGEKVYASIDGILRGIIRDGYFVEKGLKIADIDPRLTEYENCFTISDKARSIGAAVVTTILHHYNV